MVKGKTNKLIKTSESILSIFKQNTKLQNYEIFNLSI